MTVEEKILEKISVLTEITIILYREGTYVWGKGSLANNPIIEQEELRQMLVGKTDSQQVPVIYQDKHQVVFAAAKRSVIMDAKIGKLSQNEMLHWKKAIVAEITLCTRTAIEGGVVPAEAYQISDYFIEKSDECKDISAIIVCRNIAIKELTERVLKIKRAGKKSPYIEQCIEYIEKNYRKKISISNMAERVGLNNSYLSRLFSKEMGISIQEYIIRVRLEKAAYQLVYSDASITEIAAHVNFATPSYFGKMFHKYHGMTPTEYRKKYKI